MGFVMTRTLSERVRDPWWWLEQVAHLVLGGAIVYAFSDMGDFGSLSFSTFLGVLRELIQNLRFNGWRPYWDGSIPDAGVDMTAWVLGAILAALIF